MSAKKKNSITYTIPADTDSDDDAEFRRQSRRGKVVRNSSHMMNPMHQMNSVMNSMLGDPFGMFSGFGGMGRRGRGRELMPFGFPNMNDIFENFQVSTNDPNCHSFSSSTIMTMSSGPDGRPQVYQASQSTRTAPGGIRETKKAVCDSRTGTKKLAIGHHIGERSHIMEREQNLHSGQEEERQEFINLDEDEAEEFNREWETKARVRSRRPREDIPAILDRYRTRSRITSRRHHYPAITSAPSSAENRGKKRSSNEESDKEETKKKINKQMKSSNKKAH